MPHKLLRITEKLCNTPHLINEQSFDSIIGHLAKRNDLGDIPKMEEDEDRVGKTGSYLLNEDTATAVLYIDGPLTNKSTGWEAFCGGTSYEALKEEFSEVVALGAKTVVFMADSGGGEAAGMMDTGRFLRKMADDNGVRIFSYVDGGMAASACYGLIAISDEIIAQADAELGSIGVLVRLMNDSKKLEKEGYERTFITSGSEKVPFAADGSFRKEFLEDIQYKVDKLYENFTSYVAEHRGMTVEAVKSTEAKTYLAQDAVDIGLADQTMTIEEFYDYIAEQSQKRETPAMKTNMFKFNKKEDVLKMQQLEELQAAHEQLTAVMVEKETAMLALGEQVATLTAAMQEKETLLADAVEKLAEMEATTAKAQAEAKLAERTAQLSEVMPKEEATTTAASLEALADAAFGVVLSGYQRQYAAMQQSEMFQQLSTSVPVETQQDTQEATLENPAVAASRAAMKARGL